jgi:hypothetical protein
MAFLQWLPQFAMNACSEIQNNSEFLPVVKAEVV